MPRVTRNIELDDASDLLSQPARACIGVAGRAGPAVRPVAFAWHADRYFVRADPDDDLLTGDEVVLLVDDGVQFFDLRAVYVRGTVAAAAPPPGAAGGRWLEVVPGKVVAWDYAQLRSVPDDA